MANERTTQVFLRIPNLERYQHYKERKPPWVKQYRDFWTDYDLAIHTAATRLLALFLISFASEFENGRIPLNLSEISRRVSLDKTTVDTGLKKLLSSGFIETTKRRTLASRKQKVRSLVQSTEVEKEKTLSASVKEVFDYWVEARGKNPERTKLTDGRKRVINARLKDFAVGDIRRAIDGVANDPWEGRSEHDDLTVIFRPENFEKFLALADTPRSFEERREAHLRSLA